jgi:nitric oxide reductase large subunit
MKRLWSNWRGIGLWFLGGGSAGILLVWLHRTDAIGFYAPLRGPFIGGFISVSSFLFSMMTNIVFKMKEELYDSPEYKGTLGDAAYLNGERPDRYAPLERFSHLLLGSIACCFLTSVLQIAVGSFPGHLTIYMCLFTAGASIGLLFATGLAYTRNLNAFFAFWREKIEK